MEKSSLKKAIIGFIVLIVIILAFNQWVQRQVTSLKKEPIRKADMQRKASNSTQTSKSSSLSNEIIRRTRVLPGTEYVEHIFYRGDQKIAVQKVSPSGILEQTGTIPDGKVKFFDSYRNTHGVETYRNGKREGLAKAYYDNGQVRSKAYYRDGKLVVNQEYYDNGNLRFEVDYSEARDYGNEKEVGVEKLYFRDGTLKYEWNLTTTEPIGYKKSYSRDGRLRHADYFDEEGNLIKK